MDNEINIKTLHYNGPFNLLLYLIKKKEIDIQKLNLTEITQQYLDYLNLFSEYNFDLAGDFLLMATTLVQIKSGHIFSDDGIYAYILHSHDRMMSPISNLIFLAMNFFLNIHKMIDLKPFLILLVQPVLQ